MSTKNSLRSREATESAAGFHLFEDCFEVADNENEAPVYLTLERVRVELETCANGVNITVKLSRELAIELGLVPPAQI